MSIPLWKQTILERKEKKKEEEKRRAAEAEQRRLDALPPWKRVIEERNVIIVSADKSTPEAIATKSNTILNDNKDVSNNIQLTRPTRPRPSSSQECVENEKYVDGVSEEHCSSVGDNPFLKHDRSRPRHRTPNTNSNRDPVKCQPNIQSSSHLNKCERVVTINAKSSISLEHNSEVKDGYNNSDDLKVCKLSDADNESIDEIDLADKKQLSVSELLCRFRSSSQENLLDIGLSKVSPRSSDTSVKYSRTPRSKSLDRNMDNNFEISAQQVKLHKPAGNSKSSHDSKPLNSNLKTDSVLASSTEYDNALPHRPIASLVPTVSHIENYMSKRKKKNKPDLSASELINLGEDVPLSPLSTVSPFNFEIIESAHIQRKFDVNKDCSFGMSRNRDGKTNSVVYNSSSNMQVNKYEKHIGTSKTSGKKSHKLDIRKKATNSDETSNLPLAAVLPKHNNIQENFPIPPPRNKKKKKAPKLQDDMKKVANTNVITVNKSSSSLINSQHTQSLQTENSKKTVMKFDSSDCDDDEINQPVFFKKEVTIPKNTNLLENVNITSEEQLPVSNIDDIVLSPIKHEIDESFITVVNGKNNDAVINETEEKKKGITKKITLVEFIGENEPVGKPSILLKTVDNTPEIKTKKSVKFDQQLNSTFEYASEVSANTFFDEIESVGNSESEPLMDDSNTKLEESITHINEDDEVKHKAVEEGLKSNTSIGNKGLQAYVPSYLQNAYMSTIEKRRNQDKSQSFPTKEFIEDDPVEAVPETTSDPFSGWSSGNTAMLF